MQFIAGTLQQTWNNAALRDLMDLTMLPYGNAQKIGALVEQGEDASYQCQHGQFECWYNMMEGCAIHKLTQAQYMPYIFCANAAFTANAQAVVADVITKCAPDATSHAAITTCFGSGSTAEAWSIVDSMGTATAALGHSYIPWIVVGGTQSATSAVNLPAALCQAHVAAGGVAPAACSAGLLSYQLPDQAPSVCMKSLTSEENLAFKDYLSTMDNKTHKFKSIYAELDVWQTQGHPRTFATTDEASSPSSMMATQSVVREHYPKELLAGTPTPNNQRVLVRREGASDLHAADLVAEAN